MPRWAIRIRIWRHRETHPAQFRNGKPGYVVLIPLAGLDARQSVCRLQEGGAEDGNPARIVLVRTESSGVQRNRQAGLVVAAMDATIHEFAVRDWRMFVHGWPWRLVVKG